MSPEVAVHLPRNLACRPHLGDGAPEPIRTVLASVSASQGEVAVASGARAALERGKSLLAIGVRSVSVTFDAGAPVEVRETGGEVFAKGLARHSSDELRTAAGRRREDLPPGAPHVVVYANDLGSPARLLERADRQQKDVPSAAFSRRE